MIILPWLNTFRAGIVFENFMYPLCVERDVYKDGRLVCPCTTSAMDAHSNYDLDLSILTYERTTIIPLKQTNKTIK